MAHVPHLLIPQPWSGPALLPSPAQRIHLSRVLRLAEGEEVSYTDGAGRRGRGLWERGTVVRGEEEMVPPPAVRLRLLVAPPEAKDRQRFLVEKAAELGVWELGWLQTRYGRGGPPRLDKAEAWAQGALEQSRGAWQLRLLADPLPVPTGEGVLAAELGGGPPPGLEEPTVLVGPEGGWAPGELPDQLPRLGLGATVLRVETAAIAAAVLLLRCGPSRRGVHAGW